MSHKNNLLPHTISSPIKHLEMGLIAAGVPLCTFFIIPRGPSTKEQGVFSLIGPARASFREFSTTSPLNRRKKRTQIAKPTLVSSSSEELALVKWTAPSPQLALVKWTSPWFWVKFDGIISPKWRQLYVSSLGADRFTRGLSRYYLGEYAEWEEGGLEPSRFYSPQTRITKNHRGEHAAELWALLRWILGQCNAQSIPLHTLDQAGRDYIMRRLHDSGISLEMLEYLYAYAWYCDSKGLTEYHVHIYAKELTRTWKKPRSKKRRDQHWHLQHLTFVALEACVWEFLHELLYPQATDAEEVTIEEKYIIKKHRMQAGGKKSEDWGHVRAHVFLASGTGINYKFISYIPAMVQAAHAKMHRARGPQFPLRIIISIALEQRVEPSYHGSFTRSYRPITSWREDPIVFKIAHVPRAVRRIKKWDNGPVLWSREKVSPFSPIILKFLPGVVLDAVLIALGERGYDQKEARVTIGIHWDINPKPSQPVPTKSPKKDSAKSQVNALEKRLAKTLAADRKKIRKLNRLARKALVAAVLPQEPLT